MTQPPVMTPETEPHTVGAWLGETFRLFGAQWIAWVVLGAIVVLAAGIPQVLLFMAQAPDLFALLAANPGHLVPMAELAPVVEKHRTVAYVCNLLSAVFWLIGYPGMLMAALRQIDGGRVSAGDLVGGLRHAWASVLLGLPVVVGVGACFLPGVFIAAQLAVALPLVIDRKAPLLAAIAGSVGASGRVLGLLLVFAGVLLALLYLGPLCCGVGAFVTTPLVAIGSAVAYRRLSRAPEAPAADEPQAPAPTAGPPPTPRGDIACAQCAAYLPEDLERCPKCGHPRAPRD